jgi:hypothetical protein
MATSRNRPHVREDQPRRGAWKPPPSRTEPLHSRFPEAHFWFRLLRVDGAIAVGLGVWPLRRGCARRRIRGCHERVLGRLQRA